MNAASTISTTVGETLLVSILHKRPLSFFLEFNLTLFPVLINHKDLTIVALFDFIDSVGGTLATDLCIFSTEFELHLASVMNF
eukprot:snap_masked-scaffold_42-processed-gene-2.34-mRNA-1 protein AED:1.00 eAED:1.00 QI:0/0/0/0/1/1/3/0/82